VKFSKNRKKQIEGIDFDKIFSVEEGLKLIKERKFVKFDESIDVALNTTIDTKQSDQNVRGSFVPPHGLGKKVEIAVFASGKNAEEATALGVKHVGGDDLVTILEKNIDVDVIIATPDMMSTVSKMAKILGPKGMMPNPKTGTVTNDVKTTITNINKGLVAYKNDKAGTIHASIGRISFDDVKLSENITSFVEEVKKNKPTNVKGNYINSVYISSSMGIGIKVSV
jgi:large subunit ribosomal protein L1|tara:strand:+ start:3450 stop:4124 length:675 start_codon:yes stop_codon:yes gene_type:complete